MKKLISLLLTLAMLACVLTAAADEISEPVTVNDGMTHSYDADISVGDQQTAVTVSGSGSEAIVTGNVTAGDCGKGVMVSDGGTVEVDGDAAAGKGNSSCISYGVYAKNGTASVSGSVTVDTEEGEACGTGVYAANGGEVSVGGSVEAGEFGEGVFADNGSVTVGGGVSAGIGINIMNSGFVSVSGDVSANATGAHIYRSDDFKNGALVAEGALSGAVADIHVAGVGDSLPDIVVGSLGTGKVLTSNSEIPGEAIFSTIKYIINAEGITVVSGAGTYENKLTGAVYDVANEKDVLTISAAAQKGSKLTSIDFGSYADEVVKNGDGTYTLTVRRGGGLNFKAVFEKIKQTKKKSGSPAIRVIFEEETPAVSAESPVVKAAVICSDMAYAKKQFAAVTFRLDGKEADDKYFTVTLSADGGLEIALAEELLKTLEPGVHTVEIRLANGKLIPFEITAD